MTETPETRRERGEQDPLTPNLEHLRTELIALIDTLGEGFAQLLELCRRLAVDVMSRPEVDSMISQLLAGQARLTDLQQRLEALLSRLEVLQAPEAIRLLREGRARLQCIALDQIQPALADLDAILCDWPEEEPA